MRNKLKIFPIVLFVSFLYCGILGVLFNHISAVPVLSLSGFDSVEVPIIMYHSVLKNPSRSGPYVVRPSEVENDIKYLKKKGYSFVSGTDLINYAYDDVPLPKKPVMLTFDDGNYNNYGYILPMLIEYDAKALISIVGKYTDEYSQSNIKNMSYGYLRWSDVYDLYLNPRTDVGNHSYDFHSNDRGRNGAKRKRGEPLEKYKEIFCEDTEKLQEQSLKKTGFEPVIYTYPFGAYTEETTDMLKEMGFKMSLTCEEGMNYISRDTDSLFLLKRYNRPSGISTADFITKIEKH